MTAQNSANGFQGVVNRQPAPAANGDFADANVRMVVIALAGGLIAAPGPLSPIVGNFAWGHQAIGGANDNLAMSQYQGGANEKLGFVHKEGQAVIVPWLAADELALEAGLNATLFTRGGFFANMNNVAANIGDDVLARCIDGQPVPNAHGSAAPGFFTGTGAAAAGILTVSATATGAAAVGQLITGTGVPAGTYIETAVGGGVFVLNNPVSFGSTATLAGTTYVATGYRVDSPTVVDATFTGTIAGDVLTASSVTGSILPGETLSGVGVQINTTILAQLTGPAGGAGTYLTSSSDSGGVGPVAMVSTQGHLAQISTWG